MAIKPILFNTEMVRALLDDRKTCTRRVAKLKCNNTHLTMRTDKYGTRLVELQNEEPGITTVKNPDGTTTHKLLACIEKSPPYRPGDILYVRETFGTYNEEYYLYRADYPDGATGYDFDGVWCDLPGWRPSIHMPKEAARIFLRVTDVRVERLQDITEEQCAREGCNGVFTGTGEHIGSGWEVTPQDEFNKLWDSTIKPVDRALYGWDANPWVWVIEFERVDNPELLTSPGGEADQSGLAGVLMPC